MSTTRTLASYLSNLKYEDLPPSVIERGKVAILDVVGNAIGGYPLSLSKTFLDMAKDLGGGRDSATLIGDGSKVSVPMAAFGNGALSTMLDYSDYRGSESRRTGAWMSALAVPAALAAGESPGISGRDLIASSVAGFECVARILHSMDTTIEQAQILTGQTVSVFAAAGAAGRALGLDEDQMLSALGMAGIYTPVPAGLSFTGQEGVSPRKDIKQGWAWFCMTGTFAAISAQKGLKMLQENNILDGDRGLWRMLGMDVFKEKRITADLGEKFHINKFQTKVISGCSVTHTAITSLRELVRDHGINPGDIDKIDVITAKGAGIGFDDQEPQSVVDRQFSMPYQLSASLFAGDPGPNWYLDKIARSPQVTNMMKRVRLSFDEECERIWREQSIRVSKVHVVTNDGNRYETRTDGTEEDRSGGKMESGEEIRKKFITTTSQVIDGGLAHDIANTIENLEEVGNVSELIHLLRVPA